MFAGLLELVIIAVVVLGLLSFVIAYVPALVVVWLVACVLLLLWNAAADGRRHRSRPRTSIRLVNADRLRPGDRIAIGGETGWRIVELRGDEVIVERVGHG